MADKKTIMTWDTADPEWFTPSLKYLSMKKKILEKFPDQESWGEFGTEKQVNALSSLLDYLARTRNLADQFPQLSSDIILDNKNLVVGRALPLPNRLYEQLLLAIEKVLRGSTLQFGTSLIVSPWTLLNNFL